MKHSKIMAVLLALALVLAGTAMAFAEGGGQLIMGNPNSNTEEVDNSADNTDGSGNIVDPADPSKEITPEELAQRKEIYTITALVALAAIAVGIKEKRSKR